MDVREKRIRERVRKADRAAEAAKQARRDFEARETALQDARERVLARARQEVEAQRPILMARLREEIEQKRSVWEAELQRDREHFQGHLKVLLGTEVLAVAKRLLRDLADAPLERQVAQIFLHRIEDEAGVIRAEAEEASQWRVVSAFEMDAGSRGMVSDCLNRVLGADDNLQFERDPDLICGMALQAGGKQWGWSVEGYLQELEQKVTAALSHGLAGEGEKGSTQ